MVNTRRARVGVKAASHSVRCTEDLWGKAQRRADAEGVPVNFAVAEILEGYTRGMLTLPDRQYLASLVAREKKQPRGAGHSIRTTDDLWHASRRQAGMDDITMNDVFVLILDGYGAGTMNLPKITKTFVTGR